MSSTALTIQAIGDGSGVVLPQELLDDLGLRQGDRLFASRTPDGIVLRSRDESFARQLEVAREVMHKDRAILRELAK